MILKLIEYDSANKKVGSTIIIDRDSISAVYTRYQSEWQYDTKDDGQPDFTTGHEVDIDYREIMLKNGHCFQVISSLELICDLINNELAQGDLE